MVYHSLGLLGATSGPMERSLGYLLNTHLREVCWAGPKLLRLWVTGPSRLATVLGRLTCN